MPSERRFAELRSVLERHGWTLDRISGSHHIFEKEGQPHITLAVHKGRCKFIYVRKIEKALGIKL